MNQFRDEKLHTAFLDLGKIIIDYMNRHLDNQSKRFLEDLKFSTLYQIFSENFDEIKNSNEYQNFQKILQDNEKYVKNFSIPVGIVEWMFNKPVDQWVKDNFMNYLQENGLVFQTNTLDKHYSDFEKFLLDEEIKVTVNTPIIGLQNHLG